mmetsp:Transcript_2087/g.7618  ORF Transcript_2087/g.7618 Transcript_2087/m.7618 type:complete len:610 (-) Transcript_2087:176-2005(-)
MALTAAALELSVQYVSLEWHLAAASADWLELLEDADAAGAAEVHAEVDGHARAVDAPSAADAADEAAADVVTLFKKVDVAPLAPRAAAEDTADEAGAAPGEVRSGLTHAILGPAAVDEVGRVDDGDMALGEALTIYLPNRKRVALRVSLECTVAEAISRALLKVAAMLARGESAGRGADALGVGDAAAACYELRLHDVDGEPEDCPALDRSHAALAFGADELCLVQLARPPVALALAPKAARRLHVYLPDRTRVTVDVNASTRVRDAIGLVLHRADSAALGSGAPAAACYELRLHDAGGEPDDDFPALEQDGPALSFGTDEVCLVLIPGKKPPPAAPAAMAATTAQPDGADAGASLADGVAMLTIELPSGEELRLKVDAAWTVRELVPRVLRRRRMHAWALDWGLRMRAADRDRLCLPFRDVCEHLSIRDLDMAGVHTLELYSRQHAGGWFVDAPPAPEPKLVGAAHTDPRGGGPRATANAAPITPDDFNFNPATGPAFREWNVVKRNELGRRQERVLGIDGTKIYNTKRDHKSARITATQRPFHLLSNILRVTILDSDPSRSSVEIVYVEASRHLARSYTLESAYDAAHVAAKIKYNRKLRLSDAAEA